MNEGNGMNLESMSLEALWTLFPITFVSYTDRFKKVYLEEEKNLRSLLGETIIRINHIGSTSIKNIKTKPIVDLLIEIDFNNKDKVKALLATPPYILMNETPTELSFVKGYTHLIVMRIRSFIFTLKNMEIVMNCILEITLMRCHLKL